MAGEEGEGEGGGEGGGEGEEGFDTLMQLHVDIKQIIITLPQVLGFW